MFTTCLGKKVAIVAAVIVGLLGFCFQGAFAAGTTDNLRPSAVAGKDGGKAYGGKMYQLAKSLGLGFTSKQGAVIAHNKGFRERAQRAFEDNRAVALKAAKSEADLRAIAANFLSKTGEVGVTEDQMTQELANAQKFLQSAMTDSLVMHIIAQISKMDEKQVRTDIKEKKANPKALEFLELVKKINSISAEGEKLAAAKKALIEDTRLITFIFGSNGFDPYLYSVGNVLSKEYSSLISHIGQYAYEGSQGIEGGPRTIYTTLGRIKGYSNLGDEGIEAFQATLMSNFLDLAAGKHISVPKNVEKQLTQVNDKVDQEYVTITKGVVTQAEAEEEVIETPQVKITKGKLVNDIGHLETFYISGSSKVAEDIEQGTGKKMTLTLAKADTGSKGGHGGVPGEMIEAVAEKLTEVAEKGLILDFRVYSTGDDIGIVLTHARGEDDPIIHRVIWDAFIKSSTYASNHKLYGAGQDLLAESFSGNLKGMGPSITEGEFLERPAETVAVFFMDKTNPMAFNQAMYSAWVDPRTSTYPTLGRKNLNVPVEMQLIDFAADDFGGAIGSFNTATEKDVLADNIRDNENFSVYSITVGGEKFAGFSASRLINVTRDLKGEPNYVGKDDPTGWVRVQGEAPAIGEVVGQFVRGKYIVEGWMRGSSKAPLFPSEVKRAKVGWNDGPPLVTAMSYNIRNGRIVGDFDEFGANDSIREIQAQRARLAKEMWDEGFTPAGYAGNNDEQAYQIGRTRLREKYAANWKNIKDIEAEKAAAKAGIKEGDGGGAAAVSTPVVVNPNAITMQASKAEMVASARRAAVISDLQAEWGDVLAPVSMDLARSMNFVASDHLAAIDAKKGGRIYPILINYSTLVKNGPDGVMMLKNIAEQLQLKNIKLVLHVDRDGISVDDARNAVARDLALISKNLGGYADVSLDMVSGIVVGTDAQAVAAQVETAFGAPVYEVIGTAKYVSRISAGKSMKKIIVEEAANKAQLAAISAAIRLGLEIIPVDGNVNQEALTAMDKLFRLDGKDQFTVQAATISGNTARSVELYQNTVVAEIKA